MNKPKLTKIRIVSAFSIAVIADLIELPITYLESFHFQVIFLAGEFMDIVLDFIVMAAMTFLLGYHWTFLPSFLIEVVPDLDICRLGWPVLPTWFRNKKRKKTHNKKA